MVGKWKARYSALKETVLNLNPLGRALEQVIAGVMSAGFDQVRKHVLELHSRDAEIAHLKAVNEKLEREVSNGISTYLGVFQQKEELDDRVRKAEIQVQTLSTALRQSHHVFCSHSSQQVGGPGCICNVQTTLQRAGTSEELVAGQAVVVEEDQAASRPTGSNGIPS